MEHVEQILNSIDKDVQLELSKIGPDIILLLMEKWDRDAERLTANEALATNKLLQHYVFLKLCLHHLKREQDQDEFNNRDDRVINLTQQVNDRIKEARKNYYVAKQRNENHQSNCNCRGCRCIGGVSP